MVVIKHRKIFFILSGLLVFASIVCLALWQLNFGIDFKGGSLAEIEWVDSRPNNQEIQDVLVPLDLGNINIQATGEKGTILRLKDIDEDTHQEILNTLKDKFGDLEERRFESIGPAIGAELKKKAFWSISLALVAILIFVAWAFRKVSFPIKSYRYGIIAVIALFHDVLIVMGVFSFLGRLGGVEVGVPFVAALLTVLGYSVNDSIVVFDRIRENLLSYKAKDEEFSKTVGRSLKQTITRSINTSLTTLLVLFAIFLFGGVTIKFFALALIIGIALGTYSSIFLASPLLVVWERRKRA